MGVEIDSKKLKDIFLNNGLSTKRSNEFAKRISDKIDELIKIKETKIKKVSEVSTGSRKVKKEEVIKNDDISV